MKRITKATIKAQIHKKQADLQKQRTQFIEEFIEEELCLSELCEKIDSGKYHLEVTLDTFGYNQQFDDRGLKSRFPPNLKSIVFISNSRSVTHAVANAEVEFRNVNNQLSIEANGIPIVSDIDPSIRVFIHVATDGSNDDEQIMMHDVFDGFLTEFHELYGT